MNYAEALVYSLKSLYAEKLVLDLKLEELQKKSSHFNISLLNNPLVRWEFFLTFESSLVLLS